MNLKTLHKTMLTALLLVTAVASGWGQNISEGFNGGTTAPAGWTFTAIAGTYTTSGSYGASSPSLKFGATNNQIISPIFANATGLSFWFKGQATDANSALKVETYDGSNWTVLEDIKPIPTTATTKTYPLTASVIAVKWTYTKSAGNVAFDDVLITIPDVTAPMWTPGGYPKASNIGETQLDVVVNLNEAGKAFYKLVAKDATPLTAAEVKADNNAITVTAASTDYSATITSLTANTSYDLYVVAEDALVNLQATPFKIQVTTKAARTLTMTKPATNDVFTLPTTMVVEGTATNVAKLKMQYYEPVSAQWIDIKGDNNAVIEIDVVSGSYSYNLNMSNGCVSTNTAYKFRVADLTDANYTSNEATSITITDAVKPTLKADACLPTINATEVNTSLNIDANHQGFIQLGFDEPTALGTTGKIYIKKYTNDAIVEEFDAAAPAGKILVADNGYSVRITPNLPIPDASKLYVIVEDGVIKDLSGNSFAGISNKDAFSFTTVDNPDLILNTTFDTDLTPWTAVSTVGDQIWTKKTASGNGFASMSGYVNPNNFENEDYLISPEINFDASTGNKFSFKSAKNYGDANTTLKIFISTNFNGTYDAASIQAATWDEITVNFTLAPGGNNTFVASGEYTITKTGKGYLAFRYNSPATNTSTWQIDDIQLTGFIKPGSDATLKSIAVDGTNIANFSPATLFYTVDADPSKSIPTITAEANDASATIVITPATNFDNVANATTTIVVTAQDGNTKQTYSVKFNPLYKVSIKQIQEATDGVSPYFEKTVETSGIVTAIQTGKGYFIQDGEGAWNGLYVYPNTSTGLPSIGDQVTVSGYVDEFYTYTELVTKNGVTLKTTVTSKDNALPNATIVTTSDANTEKWEGVLVKVENAAVKSGPDSNKEFVINNSTADLQVDDKLFLATLEVGKNYSIVGVMDYSFDKFKLLPRDASDVVIATGINEDDAVSTKAYPNPFSTDFKINAGKVVRNVVVSNMLGQKVMERTYNEIEIEVPASDLRTGVYFVTVKFEDGTSSTLRMVKK